MTQEPDDAECMLRIARADAQAYRLLCDRHLDTIMSYAHRMLRQHNEAEDVAQETFLRLWTSAGSWTPKARPSAWLHRVAHNLCIDRLRARREHGGMDVDALPGADRPNQLLARKELAARVEDALAALPERQRAAITLVHHQGMTQDEAAHVLGVGVEALESLLARARRTLRQTLADLERGSTP